MGLDQHQRCVELRRTGSALKLREESHQEIAEAAASVDFVSGQVVALDSEIISHVDFALTGRLALLSWP